MALPVHFRLLLLVISCLALPAPALAKRPLRDEPLCTAPFSQHRPRIVTDERGGAIVAWQDFRSNYRAENYAQRLQASGKVDPDWPVNGRSLANGVDNQRDVIMVRDGVGGAIVAWEVIGGSERDHIVYVHHVTSSGDLDPAWPAEGRALSTPPGVQLHPAMVGDGRGGIIVTWIDYRSGSEDIYAQHVLASGVLNPAWPPTGVPVCTAPGYQLLYSIVSDGAGGAIAAWVDRRSGPGDIYAQHVLASSELNPAWPSDGLAVCPAPGDQVSPVIVTDGAGGALVAWGDLRASNGDIYAQHLVASGADPAWPSDGLVICGTGTVDSYAIAADGDGGALLAWSDRRGSIFDVYAHHLLSWGVDPAWPVNGRAVSTGPSYQIEVAIAADNHGRAFVTWRDFRNGNADIYALRLDPLHPVRPQGPGPEKELGLRVSRLGQAAGKVSIDFQLHEPQPVSIDVFDVMGRAVRTIAVRNELPAGPHAFAWDGADGAGAALKRGVYLVRLRIQGRSVTRKHLVLP